MITVPLEVARRSRATVRRARWKNGAFRDCSCSPLSSIGSLQAQFPIGGSEIRNPRLAVCFRGECRKISSTRDSWRVEADSEVVFNRRVTLVPAVSLWRNSSYIPHVFCFRMESISQAERRAYFQRMLQRELADSLIRCAPLEDIRVLLALGAQVNEPVTQGLRPIHYAIYQQYQLAVEFLLLRGLWTESKHLHGANSSSIDAQFPSHYCSLSPLTADARVVVYRLPSGRDG